MLSPAGVQRAHPAPGLTVPGKQGCAVPRCLRFLLWVAVGPHPAAAGKKNMDKRKTNRSHPCAAAGTPLTPTAPQPSMGGGPMAAPTPRAKCVTNALGLCRSGLALAWGDATAASGLGRAALWGCWGDPNGFCPSPAFGDSQTQGGQMVRGPGVPALQQRTPQDSGYCSPDHAKPHLPRHPPVSPAARTSQALE